MNDSKKWLAIVAFVAAALVFTGLTLDERNHETEDVPEITHTEIEPLPGTDLKSLSLSAKAAERLGIETTNLREQTLSGTNALRKFIPYSAVLYDPDGTTWVYINPERLVFVRHKVIVERIEGNQAILTDGPAAGTSIVTIGAAELLGAEYGVGD